MNTNKKDSITSVEQENGKKHKPVSHDESSNESQKNREKTSEGVQNETHHKILEGEKLHEKAKEESNYDHAKGRRKIMEDDSTSSEMFVNTDESRLNNPSPQEGQVRRMPLERRIILPPTPSTSYPPAAPRLVSIHGIKPPMHMNHEQKLATAEDADLTDAMVFLNRIKEDFAENLHIYDSFLETMRDFKFGKIEANEVCKAIRILFKDKTHLIKAFDEYLPHHLKQQIHHGPKEISQRPVMSHPPMQQPVKADQRIPMHADHGMPQYRPIPPNYIPPNQHPFPFPVYPSAQRPIQNPRMPMMNQERFRTAPHVSAMKVENSELHLMRERQSQFISKLKKKYPPNSIIYSNIIEAMVNQHIDTSQLCSFVKKQLKDDLELFEDFQQLCNPEHKVRPRVSKETKESIILEKISLFMEEKGLTEVFNALLNFYNQNFIKGHKLFFLLENLMENKEYIQELKNYLRYTDFPSYKTHSALLKCERIGSYVVLKERIRDSNCPEFSKEILNNRYLSLSTHTSEDDVYIFRNKNSSEEYLVRLGDDRSEFDVQMQKLKFLICQLEKLYAILPEESKEIEICDIEMSPAVLKDVFKQIYGEESANVLDKILSDGKNAIPRVIQRCYTIYKEFSRKQRENRLNWRVATENHYYKSYDLDGIEYKAAEIKQMKIKVVRKQSSTPISIPVKNNELIGFIQNLYNLYIQANYNTSKKISVQQKADFFKNVVENITSESFDYSVYIEYYVMYLYILRLYERFEEISCMELPVVHPNQMALKLGLVEENEYGDVHDAIKDLSMKVVSKEIEVDTFEEKIRILTKCKGYKLYNLKKIISKIDKLACTILEKELNGSENEVDQFHIEKHGGIITLSRMSGLEEMSESVNDDNDD
ncbi:transcriptional regulator like prt [Nucleospora cyclopteri]